MKLLFIIFLLLNTIKAQSYIAYSENMPPYNFVDSGKVSGFSTNILKQITKNSSINIKKIEILPWKRAYEMVQKTDNTILYSTGRSKERENLFSWVGPIDSIRVGVVAKKSTNIKIEKIEELNRYKIGTITSSFVEQKLIKNGLKQENIDSFISMESQIKKLISGRVDSVAFSIPAICYFLVEMGEDLSDYEEIYLLGEAKLYFAFNKNSDSKIINELNRNIKNLDLHHLSKTYTLSD